MENFLERVRQFLSGDQAPRLLLLGGSVLLALVVIIDLFGARGRADAVRETMRMVREAEDSSVSVPSIARVPRDLASEARLAALQAEAPAMVQAAEVAEDAPDVQTAEELTEDATATDIAESEATDEASEDMVVEDTVEEVTEIETAETDEAEAIDEALVAEDATAEDASDMAEAEPADEAPAETEVAAEDVIEQSAEPEVADATAAGDDDALALLASADLANGQRVWRQCGACHVHDAEQNRGGPHLVNIIGREVGAAEGWRYSRALSEHGGAWSVESLLAWLENPDSYIPGNQMAFRGLRDEQDRIDVLGFLNASGAD